MNDATTAGLAFGILAAGLAAYTIRLAVATRRLEGRLAKLQGMTGNGKKGDAEAGTRP